MILKLQQRKYLFKTQIGIRWHVSNGIGAGEGEVSSRFPNNTIFITLKTFNTLLVKALSQRNFSTCPLFMSIFIYYKRIFPFLAFSSNEYLNRDLHSAA